MSELAVDTTPDGVRSLGRSCGSPITSTLCRITGRPLRAGQLQRQTSMKTLAILLFALVPAISGAQHQRAVFLQGEGRDNVMKRWEIARDRWQSQPKWTPASDAPPPLTIAKAVELGETWLRKRHPDLKQLVASQVTLKAQGESGPDTREGWFYRIEYEPVLAGKRLRAVSLWPWFSSMALSSFPGKSRMAPVASVVRVHSGPALTSNRSFDAARLRRHASE